MNDLAITASPLPAAGQAQPRQPAAWAAAQEFESFFLAQMLDQMASGLKTDGVFGGGQEEAIYRSMMNAEYAKAVAASGGVGLAESVYREILALQEGSTR
jgi:Rod binding domain-containing protein